jgi:hypothetical protein
VSLILTLLNFSRLDYVTEAPALPRDEVHRRMASGTDTAKIREVNILVEPSVQHACRKNGLTRPTF